MTATPTLASLSVTCVDSKGCMSRTPQQMVTTVAQFEIGGMHPPALESTPFFGGNNEWPRAIFPGPYLPATNLIPQYLHISRQGYLGPWKILGFLQNMTPGWF